MAARGEDMGDMAMVMKKINSKYSPEIEREVVNWINKVVGCELQNGREKVHSQLKNGQILLLLINKIYAQSGNLPAQTTHVKLPAQPTAPKAAFKQMENIERFLEAIAAYGVPVNSMFQTVDLFEARNMAQVMNTLLQLGTECQRNGFGGPVCGPKPCCENRRHFSNDQLKSSECVLPLQSGTNKFASQSGMSMGGQRHVSDLKVHDMDKSGQGVIGLQYGTNKFASQKGMQMGGIRHIADMKLEPMSKAGEAVIGLQVGFNKGASQKGMSMGSIRQIADTKVGPMLKESEGVIGLQYGSNKGASQKGMCMGGIRHVSDMKIDKVCNHGDSHIGLQYGSNKGANQSGMKMGGQRHITDVKCDTFYEAQA